ncbi:hypothetical protein PICST_28806 [Scheffersomyces stipitis CBS 6054]|uniref:Uncharacterized protein n=1 Tax=Scheffersomyces stipitis (strain ATCC 58785 / CBS 6054 / NBRC 10063 / NRRL Y-11545) TaxID=322104 RepID=A3GH06_PICST|nr:predicted protein [Scheffersomyces stipitis CBS 6054]EAZ64009.2 hypothetical protein PICST_28806 [Scheffersomyces stipitis CBS 6054]
MSNYNPNQPPYFGSFGHSRTVRQDSEKFPDIETGKLYEKTTFSYSQNEQNTSLSPVTETPMYYAARNSNQDKYFLSDSPSHFQSYHPVPPGMPAPTLHHAISPIVNENNYPLQMQAMPHQSQLPLQQQQPYPFSYYPQVTHQAPVQQPYGSHYVYYQQPPQGYITGAPHSTGQLPVYMSGIIPGEMMLSARRKSKQSTTWSPKEDRLLRELKEVQKLGWREISAFFQDRTPNACQFRWRRIISGASAVPPVQRKSSSSEPKNHKRSESASSSEDDRDDNGNKKAQHSIEFLLN